VRTLLLILLAVPGFAQPVVNSFSAEANILTGETATLRWFVGNSPASVSIDHGVGSQSSLISGSANVTPASTTTYTLTATNSGGTVTAAWTVNVLSTGAYLRTSGPPSVAICGYSNTTPPVLAACGGQTPNFQVGDRIKVYGLAADDSAHEWFSNIGQKYLKITSLTDSGHFAVTDIYGAAITPNGPYCTGSGDPSSANYCHGATASYSGYYNAAPVLAFKVTLWPFASGARGVLDAVNQNNTRLLATSTDNGLTSLVASGGTATATFSYTLDSLTLPGNYVSVWNTTAPSGDLNGEHIITAVGAHTIQFATTSPDNTYTHNDACLPSNRNCVTISQWAITNPAAPNYNAFWLSAKTRTQWCATLTACESVFDGGTYAESGVNFSYPAGLFAIYSFVDRAGAYNSITALTYFLTHVERVSGVNFVAHEYIGGTFGATNFLEFGGDALQGVAIAYALGSQYLTAPQKTAFLNKIYNDTPYQLSGASCNKVLPHPNANAEYVAYGAAQGGSTTSITLASSDTAANGFYVNNAVYWVDGSHSGWGLIATYTSSTKVATITTPSPYTAWSYAPTATATYQIWPTVSLNGATITGYNTKFQSGATPVVAGDGIFPTYLSNYPEGWNTNPHYDTYYVSSVSSDTSAAVVAHVNSYTSSFGTTPQPFWWVKQWAAGGNDCGLLHLWHYWSNWPAGQAVQYGGAGSWGTWTFGNDVLPPSNKDSISYSAHTMMSLAAATDDTRAVADLEMNESFMINNQMMLWQNGAGQDGVGYTSQTVKNAVWFFRSLSNSIPGFPDPDSAGAWSVGPVLWDIYANYPDYRIGSDSNTYQRPVLYADSASWGNQANQFGTHPVPSRYLDEISLYYQPMSQATNYARSWLSYVKGWTPTDSIYDIASFTTLFLDLRISGSAYTSQPTQRAFTGTSRPTVFSLTGTTSWPHYQGDTFISQSGWDKSATQVFMESRSWMHDSYDDNGEYSLRIYKVGHLLNCDYVPGTGPGGGPGASYGLPENEICDAPEFNAKDTLHNGDGGTYVPTLAYIDRWAGAGNSDPRYGDALSRYAYARSNMTDAYWSRYNRVMREVAHFKKPGTEEIVVERWDIDASNVPNAPQIRTSVFYQQNLEAGMDVGGPAYQEGDTSCPGSGGCASLNTNRVVLEQESGQAADANPARVYNLISKFVAPSDAPVTLRWDGTTFTGSQGHAYRVSVCAGSVCGGTAARTDYLTIHKIATQPDAALNVTSLSAGSNWLVAQTTDKVAAFARGGALQTSFFANTTFPAGTAQHLIAGLDDQYTYDVSVGGAPVLNAATVAAQDNSLYFEAASGALSISIHGTAPRLTLLCSPPSGTATAGTAYTATCTASGGTTPYSWSVTGGVVPPGMSFSAAGILSGIPTTAGDYNLTVQVQDSSVPSSYASGALALNVLTPATPLVVTVSGATATQALLLYGQSGMDALQSCAITLSTHPDFSVVTESYTDLGGAAIRPYVAGGSTPLLAGTLYYLRAVCGASQGAAQFTTSPSMTPSSLSVPVSIFTPPGRNVATVQLQYGASPQLGSSISSPCATGCRINVPAPSGTVLYLKRVFLDASSQVVAASSVWPMLAR